MFLYFFFTFAPIAMPGAVQRKNNNMQIASLIFNNAKPIESQWCKQSTGYLVQMLTNPKKKGGGGVSSVSATLLLVEAHMKSDSEVGVVPWWIRPFSFGASLWVNVECREGQTKVDPGCLSPDSTPTWACYTFGEEKKVRCCSNSSSFISSRILLPMKLPCVQTKRIPFNACRPVRTFEKKQNYWLPGKNYKKISQLFNIRLHLIFIK